MQQGEPPTDPAANVHGAEPRDISGNRQLAITTSEPESEFAPLSIPTLIGNASGSVTQVKYFNANPEVLAIHVDRLKHLTMDYAALLKNRGWLSPLFFFISMLGMQTTAVYHATRFASAMQLRMLFWIPTLAAVVWTIVAAVRSATDASVVTFIEQCISSDWRKRKR